MKKNKKRRSFEQAMYASYKQYEGRWQFITRAYGAKGYLQLKKAARELDSALEDDFVKNDFFLLGAMKMARSWVDSRIGEMPESQRAIYETVYGEA